MPENIIMCIDEQTWQHPELVGLGGEALGNQAWLAVRSCGDDARRFVAHRDNLEEAWVVSCDDVEPINLAATLKADKPRMRVCLVTEEGCGSLLSRAHTAGIDEVIGLKTFVKRYAECKSRFLQSSVDMGIQASSFSEGGRQNARKVIVPRILSGWKSMKGNAEDAKLESGFSCLEPPAPGVSLSTDSPSVGLLPNASAIAAQPISRGAENSPQSQSAGQSWDAVQEKNAGQVRTPQQETRGFEERSMRPHMVAHTTKKAFCLPVVSGSGGAGKSTVSVLSAHVASKKGLRTLLVDYDLQFGDAAYMAGAKTPLTFDDAIAHPEKLEREISQDAQLVVIAAPSRLEAAEEIARDIPAFLDKVAGCFDVIVANTGSTWGDHHAVLLERSSAALFLIDQRMSSVRACRHALDLCARCGIASGPFRFALNKCAKGAPLVSADVSNALQGAPVFELRDGGRDVEDCLSGGTPEDLMEMGNELYTSIDYVMGQLLPKGKGGVVADADQVIDRKGFRRRGRHVNKRRGRKAS